VFREERRTVYAFDSLGQIVGFRTSNSNRASHFQSTFSRLYRNWRGDNLDRWVI